MECIDHRKFGKVYSASDLNNLVTKPQKLVMAMLKKCIAKYWNVLGKNDKPDNECIQFVEEYPKAWVCTMKGTKLECMENLHHTHSCKHAHTHTHTNMYTHTNSQTLAHTHTIDSDVTNL